MKLPGLNHEQLSESKMKEDKQEQAAKFMQDFFEPVQVMFAANSIVGMVVGTGFFKLDFPAV